MLPSEDLSKIFIGKMKMVVWGDAWDFPQVARKEVVPVISGNQHLTRLGSNQLSSVRGGTGVDNINKVIQTVDIAATKPLLQKAETPIWWEFSVPDWKEGYSDGVAQTNKHPPA